MSRWLACRASARLVTGFSGGGARAAFLQSTADGLAACVVAVGAGPSLSVRTPGPVTLRLIDCPCKTLPPESTTVAQIRFTELTPSWSAGSHPRYPCSEKLENLALQWDEFTVPGGVSSTFPVPPGNMSTWMAAGVPELSDPPAAAGPEAARTKPRARRRALRMGREPSIGLSGSATGESP